MPDDDVLDRGAHCLEHDDVVVAATPAGLSPGDLADFDYVIGGYHVLCQRNQHVASLLQGPGARIHDNRGCASDERRVDFPGVRLERAHARDEGPGAHKGPVEERAGRRGGGEDDVGEGDEALDLVDRVRFALQAQVLHLFAELL